MCMMAVLQNTDDCLLHDVEYILKQRIVHLAAVDDAAAVSVRKNFFGCSDDAYASSNFALTNASKSMKKSSFIQ